MGHRLRLCGAAGSWRFPGVTGDEVTTEGAAWLKKEWDVVRGLQPSERREFSGRRLSERGSLLGRRSSMRGKGLGKEGDY